MRGLAQRAMDPELLDLGVDPSEALRSLADLRFVNRWLGGRGSMRMSVLGLLDGAQRPSLLDVGCGSGDMPAFFSRAAPLQTVGMDAKLLHLQAAPREMLRVVADVRRLPFRERSFDVVTASLFLHHFDDDELPDLLRTLYGLARRGLVISDLHRAAVPFLFGRVAFPLLFRSRVSVQDGLVSIRRGFLLAELAALFERAGVPTTLRRVWPYRLLAVARRP